MAGRNMVGVTERSFGLGMRLYMGIIIHNTVCENRAVENPADCRSGKSLQQGLALLG